MPQGQDIRPQLNHSQPTYSMLVLSSKVGKTQRVKIKELKLRPTETRAAVFKPKNLPDNEHIKKLTKGSKSRVSIMLFG